VAVVVVVPMLKDLTTTLELVVLVEMVSHLR
jgi:hypothetical protein